MPDYNQQLITLAQQAQYSQINALLNQMTPDDVALITTSTISQFVGTLGFQFNDNATTANACVGSLRKFCEKMSSLITASAIELPLVNLVLGMEQANRGDWRAVDAVTDNLSTFEREQLSQPARNQIIDTISLDIAEGMFSNDTTLIDSGTSALRNFMSKFGASTQAASVENALMNLALTIGGSNTGDWRSIDAITDYLTPFERGQLPQYAIGTVVSSITYSITEALFANSATLIESGTAALRNFMSKFGATTEGVTIEFDVINLAMGIGASNTGDWRALDAITDYLTPFERGQMQQYVMGSVTGAIAYSITEAMFANNTTLIENGTAAMRNFMSKFGEFTEAVSVENAIRDIAMGTGASNTGDWRALDAITDYLTPFERGQMQQYVMSSVTGAIAYSINEALFTNNTTLIENGIAAMRNFMSKFGEFTEALSVGETLMNLVLSSSGSDTGDYRALDAITDYLTPFERGQMPDYVLRTVIGNISFDIIDGLNMSNSAIIKGATDALDNFMSKFGATVPMIEVEFPIPNLVAANATDALNALLKYLPDSTLDMMSPSLKSTLNNVENIYWGTASSSNVTYGTTDDTVYGLGGNDTLHGDGGNDIIYGGKGNDVLYGDTDNDILIGENGNDTLYGGTGADTFVLALQNSNFDTVKDFNTAETDKLDLSNILTSFDPLTQSILDYVSATSAGGNTTLLVDADGAGAGTARTVAVLEGLASFDVLDNYNNGTIII